MNEDESSINDNAVDFAGSWTFPIRSRNGVRRNGALEAPVRARSRFLANLQQQKHYRPSWVIKKMRKICDARMTVRTLLAHREVVRTVLNIWASGNRQGGVLYDSQRSTRPS